MIFCICKHIVLKKDGGNIMKKVSKILLVVFTIMFFNKVSAAPANTSFNDDAFYANDAESNKYAGR